MSALRFRIGHRVPRNVYEGDEPIFMAASAEIAARLVDLLNKGVDASQDEKRDAGHYLDRDLMRRGDKAGGI